IWQSLASLPTPLRNKRASGSVVEECVSLQRFSPWKLRSALRPPLPPRPCREGGSPPSFGTKLFMLAQASISVPSTEKCSLESSLRTCGRFSTATKNLFAISPSSSRFRFLQNTVASHTASSAEWLRRPMLRSTTIGLCCCLACLLLSINCGEICESALVRTKVLWIKASTTIPSYQGALPCPPELERAIIST